MAPLTASQPTGFLRERDPPLRTPYAKLELTGNHDLRQCNGKTQLLQLIAKLAFDLCILAALLPTNLSRYQMARWPDGFAGIRGKHRHSSRPVQFSIPSQRSALTGAYRAASTRG